MTGSGGALGYLAWIRRCRSAAMDRAIECMAMPRAVESPLGWMPRYEDLYWTGLDFPRSRFYELMAVSRDPHTNHSSDIGSTTGCEGVRPREQARKYRVWRSREYGAKALVEGSRVTEVAESAEVAESSRTGSLKSACDFF